MINDRIVTVGEKIRDFRLSIGATQEGVAIEFHESYMSRLEKETRYKITAITAVKVLKGFQYFIDKNNLDVKNISLEYLTETKKSQARRVISFQLEELRRLNIEDELFDKKMKFILSLVYEYETYDLGVEVYKIAEVKARNKGFIEKALDYASEGAEMAFGKDNEAYIEFKLSMARAYIINKNYSESLRVNKRILKLIDKKDTSTITKVYFNIALAYYHKENYKACNVVLDNLRKSKNLIIDDLLSQNMQSLNIGCLIKLNDLDRAEAECKELLEKLNTEDCELLWKTYKSLSAIAHRKNDHMTAKNYIEQALRLKSSIKAHSLINLYMDSGDIYTEIGIFDKAIVYYNECIELAQALKKEVTVNKALKKLTALYIKLSKTNELEALYNKVS